MLKHYDLNKQYLGNIYNYTDDAIVSELATGDKTLTFSYRGKAELQCEEYVQTDDQRYVIKEAQPGNDGTVEYTCQLDLEPLEGSVFEIFTAAAKTVTEAANLALSGTGWRVSTDITKKRAVQCMKKTPLEILYLIRDAFMCEVRFDSLNKIVYFAEQIGQDRGVYFRKDLNLKNVSVRTDSYDYCTRIIPIGKDDLRIDNNGKEYVENYQYSSKIRTIIWEDSSYEDSDDLLTDAQAKLEDLSKPKKSYSADIRDLAKLSADYSILSFGIGDTVWIVDEGKGVKEKQRIVKITEYPHDPEKNKCELSNTTLTWEEMQKQLQAAADAWQDVTNKDGTINGVHVYGLSDGNKVLIQTEINGNPTVKANSAGVAANAVAISGVQQDLTAVNARIGTVETTYLKATDAAITYATIENLNATNATVHDLNADYASFKSTATDELTAHQAIIDSLDTTYLKVSVAEATYLTAANAALQYAQIDLGNIAAGTIKTAMIDTGAIGTAQIADGSITDAKIVGLTASKITAGTLNAGVIDVVNLNADNITAGTINGQRIADGAISADKLSEQLSATIDSAVANTQVLYALSTSSTTAPTVDVWSETAPAWEEGKYMWQKTVQTLVDGTVVEKPATCISGAQGASGEDATILRIDSSRGTIFKDSTFSTILTVVIWRGPVQITTLAALKEQYGVAAYLEWKWKRPTDEEFKTISAADSRISDDGFKLAVTPEDVTEKIVFQCDLQI